MDQFELHNASHKLELTVRRAFDRMDEQFFMNGYGTADTFKKYPFDAVLLACTALWIDADRKDDQQKCQTIIAKLEDLNYRYRVTGSGSIKEGISLQELADEIMEFVQSISN